MGISGDVLLIFAPWALDESLSDKGVWMKLIALPWDST